ncbi:DUF397 domain-containing protein [Nocardia macrotermitis]|uniref:DUF397 domain-containing protein n=1 Tax=Nocardia macrotermitis TaxID=2585198 RepID=A0A7K0DEX7_9NOCA|nr:DUF397 domain-containing protein [Nocardia macrotermitis]MQY24336.1 hypothetical protein [Nocardia macrotermitis]
MTTEFYKSTYSGANNSCVEISHRANVVLIRDSKYTGPTASQPIVSIPAERWTEFTALALTGTSARLDNIAVLDVQNDGSASVTGPAHALSYRPDEWDAFMKGIADGQFDRPL